VPPGASARRRRTSGPLRECSDSRPVRGRSAISSTWHRPTVRRPRAHPPRPSAGQRCEACARGRRAVALWEVVEMARTPHPPPHRTRPTPRHLRDLPARRGLLRSCHHSRWIIYPSASSGNSPRLCSTSLSMADSMTEVGSPGCHSTNWRGMARGACFQKSSV